MADIYLDDLRFRDWWALYRIAKHPQFFYGALNNDKACVPWRTLRYIFRAKVGKYHLFLSRIVKAIRLRDTKELIGLVVLADLNKVKQGWAETGTLIAVPHQGRGIGTIARLRFVDWCLEKFDLQGIESYAHPDNLASIKIQEVGGLKKIGFIPAERGLYKSRDGKNEPRIVMSANRGEIEEALRSARERGLYTRDIPVL